MNTKEFILKLLDQGREYLKMLLPVFLAWRIPPNPWPKKKEEG
jgi:hypothetical protein